MQSAPGSAICLVRDFGLQVAPDPTIRDAIDGLTRHPPDRVQSSSSARMAGNTQLVWLTAA